jgi:hypothetical protein
VNVLIKCARINPRLVRDTLRYEFTQPKHTLEEYQEQYRAVLGKEEADRIFSDIRESVAVLKRNNKNKIVVFNATFSGGGVAEMMLTMGSIWSDGYGQRP